MDAQLSTLASQREELLRTQQLRAEKVDFLIHDMRNPLGVVYTALTMLQIVLPEEILEENRDVFEIALSSCERLQRMVENILEVARMEEGGLALHRQWVQPGKLLQRVLRRQWIGPKTEVLHLVREIPEHLPAVRVDLDVIDRVLSNLLDNAVDYTPTGGTILVGARREGDEVEVSVTDSGPGIPPERRESIFGRFDRGSETERRGFGLGLTFCKVAVEAHGGRIWVESGPEGVGSRFVFTLPVPPEEEEG
jgi:signal transduction histidine kinase